MPGDNRFFYVGGGDNEARSVDVVIKSIVRNFNWTPNVIDELFLDEIDYKGIMFWYFDLIEQKKKVEKK